MSTDEQTISILSHRLEVAKAETAAAVDALDALERLVDGGAFMWPGEQGALRQARAVLEEHKRRQSEARQVWEDRATRHVFVQSKGQRFNGPVHETCDLCGADPRNECHR